MPTVKLPSNEKFVVMPFPKTPKGHKYALTNYGRVISFLENVEDGREVNHGFIRGYPAMSFRLKKDKRKTFLVHRLMADYYLRKPSVQHKFVIHLNNKKTDNHFQNLKWATKDEKDRHMLKYRMGKEIGNYKLTAERVRLIKKKMLNGKTRLKIIAKQFGVSDMQIHRIKTGENWGHIKI